MAPSSADVPNKYDVIINGQGYLFAPSDTGLPPSVFGVKNEFSYTPTFVQRQNVSGDFGDNQQDFWLTFTERDWSLGEQQRYSRISDEDSLRRYWAGAGVDTVSVPGQVSMRQDTQSLTLAAASTAVGTKTTVALFGTSTTGYFISQSGTITSLGAHGLGTSPSRGAIVSDQTNTFFGSDQTGSVGIRKWNGAAWSTFSSAGSDALAVLNNTLYGYRNFTTLGDLVRFDTSGTATSIFTWKSPDGTILLRTTLLCPFGGDLLILRGVNDANGPAELWRYDGIAPSKLWDLPPNFRAWDIAISNGTIFIAGNFRESQGGGTTGTPAVLYYIGGSFGVLWKSPTKSSSLPVIAAFGNGLVIHNPATNQMLFYDPSSGGVHTIATVSGAGIGIAATDQFFVHFVNSSTSAYLFPNQSSTVSSATVTTSLVDFESSLDKLFRGIKIEFDSASDGDGGSMDIAYRVGDVDGSYTSLQTGATSGTEYALSGVSGRSISVKITLNKGTSTSGPILKHIAVKAAPQEPVYKQFQYVLSLAGVNDRDPYEGSMGQLRDGTFNPLDGNQQAANLVTAITSSSPISCYDAVNGTMSSVLLDQANCKISQVKPGEYIAVIVGREV